MHSKASREVVVGHVHVPLDCGGFTSTAEESGSTVRRSSERRLLERGLVLGNFRKTFPGTPAVARVANRFCPRPTGGARHRVFVS